MSYQPPFDGNWMTQNAWLTQNDKPPPSIQNAVRFIYAGAAIQALSVILDIAAVRGRIQSSLATSSAIPLTASQLNTDEAVGVGFLIPRRCRRRFALAVDGQHEQRGPEMGPHSVDGVLRPFHCRAGCHHSARSREQDHSGGRMAGRARRR